MNKVECYCIVCGKLIGLYYPSQTRKTCSKICKGINNSRQSTGKNNPRYIDGRCSQKYYCKCGVEIDRRSVTCPKCAPHRYLGTAHTKESKEKIGLKSKQKFTVEYKKLFRKKMEKNGHWIPLDQKDDYKFYCLLANWVDRMFDMDNVLGKEKLMYGVFNNKTNTKGVVRDHKFSRRSGFILGVFPEILRHPLNCEILFHSENVSKKFSRYVDKDSITLDTLFKEIKKFSGEWKEQEYCIRLIQEYKAGKRFIKEKYIKEYYEKI